MKETLNHILGNLKETAQRRKLRKFEEGQFLLSLGDDDTVSLPVACAFLLTDMALIDGKFDESEYDFMFRRLEQGLGLEAQEALRIMSQAKNTLGAGRGAVGYAEYLAKNFTVEQRQQALELLKGMVAADGKQDDYEVYLQARLSKALGLA